MTTDVPLQGMVALDPHECWCLLRGCEVARLAISITDHPDIFPINFVVDHGSVVFRTAEGTKLTGSVLGRAVAFEADAYDARSGEAWSVVIKGTAREIERMQELFDAFDLPLFPWHAGPKHRFVRITPETITGRRFHVVDRPAGGGEVPRRASEE
jgi:nitroimidazol reductase NimA-like FMN-containing flavoprotein (pyridoxamine 5'-phosphate oxidase superfamily)